MRNMAKKTNGVTVTNETKNKEAMAKLAPPRVQRALKAIAIIGNLGSRKPTDQQIAAIVNALSNAIKVMESRLKSTTKQAPEFQLPS